MAYADNLYAADDSDVESFSDELSPTDGYFSTRDHPQHMMVADPSLEMGSDTGDSKAREAREEAAASSEYHTAGNTSLPGLAASPSSPPLRVPVLAASTTYSPSSPTAYTPRSPASSHRHQDDLYSETSPLLHSIAPPPAYSAATSQPDSLPRFNTNYSTISARQLESGMREPESMTGYHSVNERSPLWVKQVQKLPQWRLFRNILLVILVLGLAIGFIIAAAKSGESKKRKVETPPDKFPSGVPAGDHGSYCSFGSRHDSDGLPTYEFKSGRDLVILQVTGGNNFNGGNAGVRTTGEIILRRLDPNTADQDTGFITFDVWLSEPGIKYQMEMDTEVQALKVVTPEFADLSSGGDHCLSLEITVWIPPNVSFKEVIVEATSLSIRVMDDADFHAGKAEIWTSSGDVYFPLKNLSSVESSKPSVVPPQFSSDDLSVKTSSGDISGIILLYDVIDIETDSGNIDISVLPQPASYDRGSGKAELILGAASGDIRCRLPIWSEAKIPDRDYHTSVQTHSGKIDGDFVIGTEASFKAISGALDIIALPTSLRGANFETVTNSGSARIVVIEPLSRPNSLYPLPADNIDIGDDDPYRILPPSVVHTESDASEASSSPPVLPLRLLTSSHRCVSGNQKILYPNAWEGEIRADTISGNIRVGGPHVRTIKDSRKNWAYHEVVARKGLGAEYASDMMVHDVSGNLDVWVGEDCLRSDWCKMDTM